MATLKLFVYSFVFSFVLISILGFLSSDVSRNPNVYNAQ